MKAKRRRRDIFVETRSKQIQAPSGAAYSEKSNVAEFLIYKNAALNARIAATSNSMPVNISPWSVAIVNNFTYHNLRRFSELFLLEIQTQSPSPTITSS
jgi:hypothetical protein